jgi:hypothetical protein
MPITRRTFLRQAGLATLAGAALCEEALNPEVRSDLLRIRGRVQRDGRGLAGAVLSDGLRTTATDADGRFELVSDPGQSWLSLSLPRGCRIPTRPTGTALLHRPIRGPGSQMDALFELESAPDGEHHTFLALADPQTETPAEMDRVHGETVPDVQATVAGLDVPVFGVSVGDIMFDHLELYPDYERAVAAMGIPFFQVVGNHDLDQDARTDEGSTATFQSRFGPARYSFNMGEVHYVVMDDVLWHGAGFIGYLSADALDWLAADLALVEAGRTVVVFVHIPVLPTIHLRREEPTPGVSVSVTNRQALYRLLEPYEAHVVSGHTHEAEHHRHGGLYEHVNGAVCGAWWSGDICYDGAPNGYTVYEARGSELRWRYKATGRAAAHQMRVYPAGSDPRAPDEIVANVWFADEDWTVTWYQGGDRRGAMARRVGLDPLSVHQHAGADIPAHRPWVEPVPTSHLYYAPASAGATDLTVEARDPWGNVFTGRPARLSPTRY